MMMMMMMRVYAPSSITKLTISERCTYLDARLAIIIISKLICCVFQGITSLGGKFVGKKKYASCSITHVREMRCNLVV